MALFGLALLLAAANADAPSVRFSPSEPRLGDVVIVYVETTDRRIQSGTIDVFGCQTPVDRVSASLLRGVVGIPTDVKPGGYPLKVTLGELVVDKRLPVDHRVFEQSELRVSKRFTKKKSAKLRRRLALESEAMDDLWRREPSIPKAIGAVFRPVKGATTSPFGVRRVFNGKLKSVHYGLDLEGRTGDPIHAALAGRVVMSAMRWASGGTTILDHGSGLFSAYFHMSRQDRAVGDFVAQGALLGAVGRTGRVTGPHLHLAVMTRCLQTEGSKKNKTRSFYVDPERFLDLTFEGDPAYLELPPDAEPAAEAAPFGGSASP